MSSKLLMKHATILMSSNLLESVTEIMKLCSRTMCFIFLCTTAHSNLSMIKALFSFIIELQSNIMSPYSLHSVHYEDNEQIDLFHKQEAVRSVVND